VPREDFKGQPDRYEPCFLERPLEITIFHDRTDVELEAVMAELREKFATQVDPTLLANFRRLAKQDGRQLQALIEEASAYFI
jgi:hypothetical protein